MCLPSSKCTVAVLEGSDGSALLRVEVRAQITRKQRCLQALSFGLLRQRVQIPHIGPGQIPWLTQVHHGNCILCSIGSIIIHTSHYRVSIASVPMGIFSSTT